MINKNPYTWSGLGLLISGIIIGICAYFVLDIVWLTALGICMIILSIILIALGKSVPKLPPEVCGLLLETGLSNIATLLEELGIKSRAVFLPSSLTNKQPQAFIPLNSNGTRPEITRALPQRLITRHGSNPEDIGILISTIGSAAAGMLQTKPGATPVELETALTTLFSGRLGVADGTRVICTDDNIRIEIKKPRMETSTTWSHQSLGSPLATIVASIAADAWDTPVVINQENPDKDKYYIELGLVR